MNKKAILICIVVGFILAIAAFNIYNIISFRNITKMFDEIEEEVIIDEVINIEGQETTIKTKEYVSSLGYIIRYDIDLYKVTTKNNCDRFDTQNDEVYFTICEEDNVVIKNTDLYDINGIKYPKDTLITIKGNILINRYYIEVKDKYLVIETQYPNTTEYIEGYGTRILNTIDSFTLKN